MTIKTNVEFARPEDIPQIVALGYQSFEDNELKDCGAEPSFEKTLMAVTNWVMNDVVLVLRNQENESLIDGVLCLTFDSSWWSEDKLLVNALYYVKKEHRSYKNASNLLRTGVEYGIMNNLPLVMDIMGRKDIDRKTKFLQRMGFVKLGSLFLNKCKRK